MNHRDWTRRDLVAGAGGLALGAALAGRARAAPAGTDITARLAHYMAAARTQALPPDVAAAGKARILDTFGAMISGARMRAGQMATTYVKGLGGNAEASLVVSSFRTTAVNAALANAMCAHADETDDVDLVTKAHPGCSTVPAALAMAEREGRSGEEVIRAVALGYDLACRLLYALGPDLVRQTHRSAEGLASTFGALGAAASLARLDERQMRYALCYAAQQASGLWSWVKDKDHIEKAFDVAGMGARNGVMGVTMVEAGFTGVDDVLDGTHNLFIALSTAPKPDAMLDGLGSRFFVVETAIKTFSVGYPNQSPLDALLTLRSEAHLTPDLVRSVSVKVPPDTIDIVVDSAMPDVNCQHLIALALVRGAVSFADSHDASLMHDPAVQAQMSKIKVMPDPSLMDPAAPRGGIVEITTTDGRTLSHHTRFPPGTKENPLGADRLDQKVRDLVAPVLGPQKTDRLLATVNRLETVRDMRTLRELIIV